MASVSIDADKIVRRAMTVLKSIVSILIILIAPPVFIGLANDLLPLVGQAEITGSAAMYIQVGLSALAGYPQLQSMANSFL